MVFIVDYRYDNIQIIEGIFIRQKTGNVFEYFDREGMREQSFNETNNRKAFILSEDMPNPEREANEFKLEILEDRFIDSVKAAKRIRQQMKEQSRKIKRAKNL